ncbi:MAG: hypothetical protein RIT81_27105 [Deltaproteobacteria bacterium]
MNTSKLLTRVLQVLLLCVAIAGCGGGGEDSPAGTQCVTAMDCQLGSGFECIDGACAACVLGEIGCPCRPGARCEDGAVCGSGNLCATPTCTLGTADCACTPAGGCVESGLHCSRNVCTTTDTNCIAGELDCACAGGSCGPGLACFEGRVCVDNTGRLGGGCFEDGSCFSGNRCERNTCVACRPGTQGCSCDPNAGCADGLECKASLCVATTGFATGPVTNPVCHTPCSDDLNDDTGFHACVDGLMEGCFGGLTCDDGQCLPPSAPATACNLDIDCPDFQACLDGFCISNCESDAGCVSGAVCRRKVCRKSCTLEDDTCPADHHCDLEDGVTGACMQDDTTTPSGPDVPNAAFSVSSGAMIFSNAVPAATVTITNHSNARATYTLEKRLQRHFSANEGLVTTAIGNASHLVQSNLNACTPGTLGCACAGPQQDLCGDLDTGLAMECASVSGNSVCRPPQCTTEDAIGCVCEGTECLSYCDAEDCPMRWLEISLANGSQNVVSDTQKVQVSFTLASGESIDLTVKSADGSPYTSWQGQLTISEVGTQRSSDIGLTYSQRPDGAWSGEVYYFGDFRVSTPGMLAWMESNHTQGASAMQNAFLQAWSSFRNGTLELDRFKALLTATQTESWRSPGMREVCPSGSVCYPFINSDGYLIYTLDANAEAVPSGVVELPFAMNVQHDADQLFSGKVVSESALQYPGDPAVDLVFERDPSDCSTRGAGGCLVFIDDFTFSSVLGARHDDGECTGRFQRERTPWLVPGFLDDATLDPVTGTYGRSTCRDTEGPYTPDSGSAVARNASLAAANPVADGQVRTRSVELIDGALINNDTLFVIFRERTKSWIPGSPDIWAYGYMMLVKQERTLEDEDFVGHEIAPETEHVAPALTCDADLMLEVGGNMNDPVALAQVLLEGVTEERRGVVITDQTPEKVHYLCVETGEFNGGADPVSPNPCPAGSTVRFFTTMETTLAPADVNGHACQANATCGRTLENWRRLGLIEQEEPFWLCDDDTRVFCSDDRHDLRNDKRFYRRQPGVETLPSLPIAVDDAFRYRTRFQNRAGTNLGFTPELCVGSSDIVPYCYDAEAIEHIEKRVDCLLVLFVERGQQIRQQNVGAYTRLRDYLTQNFSFDSEVDATTNTTVYHSGFETLDIELLIMLGDDAYTKALSSRFDLAGLAIASFPGSELEPGGIDLSGVAGAEMAQLYLARQYYQRSLDRFFGVLSLIDRSLAAAPGDQIIGQQTVSTYIGHLIRASTQKARIASEIAARYQNFSRPEIARLVIERGYVAAYMESVIFTHLMQNIVEISAPQDVAQIAKNIQTAQTTYRVALSDMRQRYDAITEDVDFFGFPPDFIPFPALEASVGRDTGFEVAANRALLRIQIAHAAEDVAISSGRSFDTDAASFQNELTRVENSYESQLLEICGSFEAEGRIFPAIRKYAYLDARTRVVGDPCGLVGNGSIHNALADIDIAAVRIQQVQTQLSNTAEEARIEEDRIDATCDVKDSWQQVFTESRDAQNTIQKRIDQMNLAQHELERAGQLAQTAAQLGKCLVIAGTSNGTDCASAGIAGGILAGAIVGIEAGILGLGIAVNKQQEKLRKAQTQEAAIFYDFCTEDGASLVQIDAEARVRTILLRIAELELEALQARYQLQQAIARVEQLRNQARRVEAELEEMTQLTINVEAARNNPNVRIYKNDAIINADTTFLSALREVYKATLVFEYHTSQSYAPKEELFLTRMVARGDYNLQNYLSELEDEFRFFEDTVGVRDQRLLRLSMRDDILRIPLTKASGEPLAQADRFTMFRERLTSGALLDENGYIAAPFNVDLDKLSPLTSNHKITFVEAELVGSGVGDPLAKVYLRMSGTSAIRELAGGMAYYTFPTRTGVINAFVNGSKPFDPTIYRTSRFTERPLVNSRWELMINRIDEPDNEDLGLDGVTDIFLYFYYSDFTNL